MLTLILRRGVKMTTLALCALALIASAATSRREAALPQALRAFVDPLTGQLTTPPLDVDLDPGLDPAKLVELEVPLAGGGFRIAIDGYYETQMGASVDGSDRLSLSCAQQQEEGDELAAR